MESKVAQKRDNTYCCVPQCKSMGSKSPQLSFHKFPNIKSVVRKATSDGRMVFVNRKKEWINILKIEKEVSKRMVVCSKHFDLDAFTFPPETCKRPRLKPFAMPSLCLPKSSTYSEEKKRIKEKNGAKRSARYEEINRKNEIFLSASEMPSTSSLITDTSNQQPCTSNQQPCTSNQQPCTSNQQPCTSNQQPCASNQMPDASIPMPSIPIEIPVNIPIETLFNSNVLPRISIDMLYLFEENEASSTVTPDEIIAVDALLDLRKIPDKLNKATQVCSGDLRTQHIIKADDLTDSQLSSLTGLRSLSLLNYLAKEVGAELNFNNKFQLPVRERIILSMMKMYLNLSFSSLAIFFGCTVKTACNIFGTVIPILSSIVGSLIEWPTKEEIVANCPKAFRFFKNVRIVVDCTEILVQKPRCLNERIKMYSHYYKDLTIKFMIGASPSGVATFVSKCYGGKSSDKHIFWQSNVIQMLEPHIDAVMADKGFR